MNRSVQVIIVFMLSCLSFLQGMEFLKQPFSTRNLTNGLSRKSEYCEKNLAHAGYIDSLSWHPAGKIAAITYVMGLERKTRIVDMLKSTVVEPLTCYINDRSVAWHPNGKLLAVGGSADGGNAMVISIDKNKISTHTILPFIGSVVSWDRKGERLAGYWSDGNMKIFNVMDDQVEIILDPDAESIAWNPCKDLLAIKLRNGRIKLRCMVSARECLIKSADNVRSLAWHANGEYLITGSYDGIIKLFDIITRRAVTLIHEGYTIRSIAWIDDKKSFSFAAAGVVKLLAFD